MKRIGKADRSTPRARYNSDDVRSPSYKGNNPKNIRSSVRDRKHR